MAVATRPKKKTLGKLTFSGPPRRLVAVGDVPDLVGADFVAPKALAVHLPPRGRVFRPRSNTRTGVPGAKLKLAAQTPPGQYKATLATPKGHYDVVIDVQPDLRVSISDPELTFTGKPGTRARFATTLHVTGNQRVTVPATAPLGIFDDDGVETALSAAYGRKFEDVNSFFGAIIGKLNEAHGGVMKLAVEAGAGTHDPGSTVLLEIAAALPKTLSRGHRYHGVWTTEFGNLAVSIFAQK